MFSFLLLVSTSGDYVVMTPWYSAGGDADFVKWREGIEEGATVLPARVTVSQILTVLLILLGALLLVNLFVAMMAQTFDSFAERSRYYFSLNLGDFIVRYDRKKLRFHPLVCHQAIEYWLHCWWFQYSVIYCLPHSMQWYLRWPSCGTLSRSRWYYVVLSRIRWAPWISA